MPSRLYGSASGLLQCDSASPSGFAVPESGDPASRRLTPRRDRDESFRRRLLGNLQLAIGVEPEALDALAIHTEIVRLEPREVLFRQGDPSRGIWAVVTGRIELALTTSTGEAKVLALFDPGTAFGAATYFLNIPYPVTAIALEHTTLLLLPRAALAEILPRFPQLNAKLLTHMSQRLHGLVTDIAGYTQKTADERLAEYLLSLAGDSAVAILPTTKQVLASRLAISPETLSRVLRRFREQGWIEGNGRQIAITNRAALAGTVRQQG